MAIAHNGNLVNSEELRERLEKEGSIFQTTTDSELIAHLVARYGYNDLESSLKGVMPYLHGAYSFLFLTEDKLICMRDPHGVRPLSLGQWQGHYVLASESCAFDTIGAEFVRDVNPGEMIVIDREASKAYQSFPHTVRHFVYLNLSILPVPTVTLGGKTCIWCARSWAAALPANARRMPMW
jgi:amidophosphoribosyltransferase